MPLIFHTPETILCTPRSELAEIACDCCDVHFFKKAKSVRADLKRGRKRFFCSKDCRAKGSRVRARVVECTECHRPVDKTREKRSKRSFCSGRCAAIYNNRLRSPDSWKQTHFTLRTYMVFEEDESTPKACVHRAATRLHLTCEGCNKPVIRTTAQMKKIKHGKPYCSKSCRMRHYNAHILERSSCQRSKAKDILLAILRDAYPLLEVIANDRTLVSNGLEVDIYIPAAKLAIELNGPVHYLPIYGEERLSKVQFKDAQKHAELHAKDIRLLVLDISHLQTQKRTETFLKTQFVEAIQPLLMEARVGVSPTIA